MKIKAPDALLAAEVSSPWSDENHGNRRPGAGQQRTNATFYPTVVMLRMHYRPVQ